MPLVERYNDWNITDGSFDDPHTLEFDHRIEADVVNTGTGLANVEKSVLDVPPAYSELFSIG